MTPGPLDSRGAVQKVATVQDVTERCQSADLQRKVVTPRAETAGFTWVVHSVFLQATPPLTRLRPPRGIPRLNSGSCHRRSRCLIRALHIRRVTHAIGIRRLGGRVGLAASARLRTVLLLCASTRSRALWGKLLPQVREHVGDLAYRHVACDAFGPLSSALRGLTGRAKARSSRTDTAT